ncbi:Enoyl reductase OS=Streptomyces tendae OX=1932 GN=F3L20_04790 PE=4 SV=1 [Streptomyces tendae]
MRREVPAVLGDGTFPLQATVTWEIHWTGTGPTGGDLPDGTFGATQDVVVQEIQAVNR